MKATSLRAIIQEESPGEVLPAGFLSEWIKKGTLLSLIVDVVQTLEWPESDFELSANSGYAFRRPVMLTVLTYCYATGVYAAKDIALRISRDEILGFLCKGTFPTWQDIRDFSRRYPDLIKQSLIQTYKLAHQYGLRTEADNPANCEWDKLKGANDLTPVELELHFARAAETWIRRAGDLAALAPED